MSGTHTYLHAFDFERPPCCYAEQNIRLCLVGSTIILYVDYSTPISVSPVSGLSIIISKISTVLSEITLIPL